jgi:sn-glycerol 3-phosphate transport system ATP-binding protein/multiple sugar transport system ATP-binding protein
MEVASLTLSGIRKKLGGNPILRGIDLEVPDGALVVLVGPSGCGKSTLLRTIAGLEIPDEGRLCIGGRDVTRLPPRDRDLAMVFQSYALYPHLTVRENMAFGLRLRGEKPETIAARVAEAARTLGLEALLDRFPRQLSGGQRQRVAMGRAIARRPSLFLFDEPLSNLDAALRSEVRVEIRKLHDALRATMVYVTHDQVEAMTLADLLVVLRAGKVEQVGPPLEVYRAPASRFVASFLGTPGMQFLPARLEHGRVRADGVDLALHPDLAARAERAAGAREVVLGIRPHDVSPSRNGHAALSLRVEVVEAMGFEAYAHGRVGQVPFVARLEGEATTATRPGDVLRLDVPPRGVHLFDPQTEAALR